MSDTAEQLRAKISAEESRLQQSEQRRTELQRQVEAARTLTSELRAQPAPPPRLRASAVTLTLVGLAVVVVGLLVSVLALRRGAGFERMPTDTAAAAVPERASPIASARLPHAEEAAAPSPQRSWPASVAASESPGLAVGTECVIAVEPRIAFVPGTVSIRCDAEGEPEIFHGAIEDAQNRGLFRTACALSTEDPAGLALTCDLDREQAVDTAAGTALLFDAEGRRVELDVGALQLAPAP